MAEATRIAEASVAQPGPSAHRTARRIVADPLLCRDRTRAFLNAYWGGSLSFLPNVGVAVEMGGIFRRETDLLWSWEAECTWQFIDDELLADDGNPSAGDWYQVQIGAKVSTAPLARRHWTVRGGAVWFYAGRNPNIVEEEGHYFGIYAGIGFETDLTPSLTMGPELSGMLVMHEDGLVEVVPQLNWHVIWNF